MTTPPIEDARRLRSVEAIRSDLEHPHTAALTALHSTTIGDGPIGRLLRDVGPLLAEVGRLGSEITGWDAGARFVRAERDAALARIAAVEARNEKLRRSADAWWEEYDEALSAMRSMRDTMQREHDLGRAALGGYLILLDRALAASPTPTGPEPATCEDGFSGPHWIPQHAASPRAGTRCPGPATPEPIEETP